MVAAEEVAPAELVVARGSRQLSLQPGTGVAAAPGAEPRSTGAAGAVPPAGVAGAAVAAPGGGAVLSGAGEEQPLTAEAIVSANNPAVALPTIVRPMFCFTTPL